MAHAHPNHPKHSNLKGLGFLNPTPDELASYATIRRNARLAFTQGKALLKHDRGASSAQFSTQLRNLQQTQGQQRERLPGKFLNRGIINSGIYRGALGQFVQKAARDTGKLGQAQYIQQAGFNVKDRQLGSSLYGSNLTANSLERARRASIAASLKQLAGNKI